MKKTELEKLKQISDILDNFLEDTDPDTAGLTDEEIQIEEPIFWCTKTINGILRKHNLI